MKKTRKNKFGNRPKGRFRSELEAYTARLLDEEGIGYKYEEVVYTLINAGSLRVMLAKKIRGAFELRPVRIFNTSYTPDFVDSSSDSPKWIIEVKGMETPEFKLKFKMFLAELDQWASLYAAPTVYMPKNRAEVRTTVNMIKHGHAKKDS